MNATATKHTPGPWKYSRWDYSAAKIPRTDLVIEGNNFKLATLDGDIDYRKYRNGIPSPYTIPEAEAEANAKLIAAAPDLLDALVEARAMLTLMGISMQDHDATRAIEAAIAKATA